MIRRISILLIVLGLGASMCMGGPMMTKMASATGLMHFFMVDCRDIVRFTFHKRLSD